MGWHQLPLPIWKTLHVNLQKKMKKIWKRPNSCSVLHILPFTLLQPVFMLLFQLNGNNVCQKIRIQQLSSKILLSFKNGSYLPAENWAPIDILRSFVSAALWTTDAFCALSWATTSRVTESSHGWWWVHLEPWGWNAIQVLGMICNLPWPRFLPKKHFHGITGIRGHSVCILGGSPWVYGGYMPLSTSSFLGGGC